MVFFRLFYCTAIKSIYRLAKDKGNNTTVTEIEADAPSVPKIAVPSASSSKNTTPRNESTPKKEVVTLFKYKIMVQTGNVSGAGTDANVLIIIYGEKVLIL